MVSIWFRKLKKSTKAQTLAIFRRIRYVRHDSSSLNQTDTINFSSISSKDYEKWLLHPLWLFRFEKENWVKKMGKIVHSFHLNRSNQKTTASTLFSCNKTTSVLHYSNPDKWSLGLQLNVSQFYRATVHHDPCHSEAVAKEKGVLVAF